MRRLTEPDELVAEVAQAIADVGGRSFGSVVVRDLDVAFGIDSSDEEAIFVTLLLSDPAAGEETWPPEETDRIRSLVRERIRDLDLPLFAYIRTKQQSPEFFDEDEPDERGPA